MFWQEEAQNLYEKNVVYIATADVNDDRQIELCVESKPADQQSQ